MLCSVPLSDVKAKSTRWRFTISLLSNQTFITSLKEYIKEFLEINMPSDVDPQILWETTKCAIRGFCISFSSTLAKAKPPQFTQLENKIQTLQNLQKQHFTEQQATQLSSLKEEYDLLSHSKAEFILHRTRQKYNFESERPSHLLALRLKECESKAYISSIKSLDDQVTTNPVAINDIFKGFYTNLYKAETDFDEPICKQYLDKLELPQISHIDKESLEAPLSLEELHVSLKSLQKGKSPGLDGIPPELYLEIWHLVGIPMLNSFNFAIEHGVFHRDQKTSLISLHSLTINGATVERVSSTKFLGVHITEDLSWTNNTAALAKKAQQRLYFLRKLRRARAPAPIMCTFYRGTIESILTSCITVWYGACNASCRKSLQRIVRAAEKIVGVSLPSLQDIYNTRLTRKALSIAGDPTHPTHNFFSLLPSGRRLRSLQARTNRLKDSFIHQAVRKLNSLPSLPPLPSLNPRNTDL